MSEINKLGFIEWMEKIKSNHYANKPAMERALIKLSDNDFKNYLNN